MAPKLFSRRAPPSNDDLPWYEQRQNDQDTDSERRRDLALDEENLAHHFRDDELATDDLTLADSRRSSRSPVPNTRANPSAESARQPRRQGPAHDPEARWLIPDDDGDNDVPPSLLMEGPATVSPRPNPRRSGPQPSRQPAASGPFSRRTQAQWETAQAQQQLHPDSELGLPSALGQQGRHGTRPSFFGRSPKDKAMYRWANVSDLDVFIRDVYDYYLGAGIWCILLDRALHLFKVLSMSTLLTLLTQCLDYTKLRSSKALSQVLIPQCTKNMWGIWNLSLWVCSFYFIWKAIQWILDVPRLLHIRDFYTYLLEIPDEDMQTVSWQDVVSKLTGLRDQNFRTATNITPSQRQFVGHYVGHQSKERLDAHDIANRLMRRENYIIALFNKDILNLAAPLPFLRHRQLFTQSLEWTVQFGVLDLIFNESGQVHRRVLRPEQRGQLGREMRTRFAFAAIMNLLFAPFVVCISLVNFVFTYYNEFKTNTSAIGARQYTPLAKWKFREFNELPHMFEERLNLSHPYAKHYIDQFPKKKTESAARFLQFLSGAIIAVLAAIGFFDPEIFVDFEIAPGMSAFGFIAILGTVWAIAQGQITKEDDVFDPEYAMQAVIEYTRYQPDQWKGRLHSYDVKIEFSQLYKPRVLIFVEELLGVLLTPLILYFSLPKCSEQIIDFFREFTIHVDGLGYICSFAHFDFKKDVRRQAPVGRNTDAREDYYAARHNKMQASMNGFLDNYCFNPRSGLPGSHLLRPTGRHQFYPPPAFPGLMSPTLAADLRASRIGRSERSHSRVPLAVQQPGKASRPGVPVAPSPMASMLLDPHHHPSASFLAGRTPQRPRQQRGSHPSDEDIIEESVEGPSARANLSRQPSSYTDDGAGIEESVARLGESTWEGSPRQPLSRENSSAVTDEEQRKPGMVQMLKQFQEAHLNHRGGVM